MSRKRTRHIQKQSLPLKSFETSEHIPSDDRYVLKVESGFPLERGGIYSEMGADMTYEELSSFPSTNSELTHFEQYDEKKALSFLEVIGIILLFIGLFILFVSPFWFATMSLGITLIAKYLRLQITMYIALLFTIIGFIFAMYNLFMS